MVNKIEEYFTQHNSVRYEKTITYSNYKDSSSFLQALKASFSTQATPVRVRFDSMEELNSFTSALVRKKVRNYPLEYRYACEKGENGYVLKHSCEEIKNFHPVNFPLIFYFESFEEIENFIEDYAGEYIPKGHPKKRVLIISACSVVFAVLCGWGIWSWVDYRAELKRELRREINTQIHNSIMDSYQDSYEEQEQQSDDYYKSVRKEYNEIGRRVRALDRQIMNTIDPAKKAALMAERDALNIRGQQLLEEMMAGR